jgi:hypothetical protein
MTEYENECERECERECEKSSSNNDNDNETTAKESLRRRWEEAFYDAEEEAGTSSRGYVEKDRGSSFPSLWIWMQTNSFASRFHRERGTSLFFSVARIPVLTNHWWWWWWWFPRLEFPGFTAAVWLGRTDNDNTITNNNNATADQNSLIPFATWTGAYFEKLHVDEDRVVAVLHSGVWLGAGSLSEVLWGESAAAAQNDSSSNSSSNNSSNNVGFLVRLGRLARAWIGSWCVGYDARTVRYKLELEADRKVPHVMLYAPKTTTRVVGSGVDDEKHNNNNHSSSTSSSTTRSSTSKMEPFVNEALNAKIRVRLVEYSRSSSLSFGGAVLEEEEERVLLDDVGEHAGLEVHQNVRYLVDNLCGNPTSNPLACL